MKSSRMLQCSACKDYDVRRSRWSNEIERIILSAALRQPVRCHTCFHRFYVSMFAEVKPRGLRISRESEKLSLNAVENREPDRHDDQIRFSAKAS